MTTINVTADRDGNQWNCRVTVEENGSQSSHTVTVTRDHLEQYGANEDEVEALVRCSFEFLLEREPKEAILSSFELDTIERYFPEFPNEIQNHL